MPIGSELNDVLPAVGDAPAVAAARIIDTFQRLVTAVESEVPSSALDVVGDVDMAGNSLTGTEAVVLDDLPAAPTAPGTIYRIGNNLWWIHPDGAFQVTDGVGLNAAGVGGIGGDYGAGAETVDYDATNDRYDFLDAPGNYSDIRISKLWIRATSGTADLKLNYTGTAGPTWTLGDIPAAGLMRVSAAGVVTSITTIADVLTFTLEPKHGTITKNVSLGNYMWKTGGNVTPGATGLAVDAATVLYIDLDIPSQHRITAVKATIFRSVTAGTASIALYQRAPSGFGAGNTIGTAIIGAAASITSTNGVYLLDKSGLATVVDNLNGYLAVIVLPSNTDAVGAVFVEYDKV